MWNIDKEVAQSKNLHLLSFLEIAREVMPHDTGHEIRYMCHVEHTELYMN